MWSGGWLRVADLLAVVAAASSSTAASSPTASCGGGQLAGPGSAVSAANPSRRVRSSRAAINSASGAAAINEPNTIDGEWLDA